MKLEQTKYAVGYVSGLLRATLYMREDEDFIRDTIGAIQDYRIAKGAGPMPHDRAYAAANFILKRLKSKGWQFSPPLPIPSGGIMTGARKGK